MPNPPLPKATDGYYHPESELDVIALVQYAAANGLTLRVRGATHSVAWSIYTDPVDQLPPNQTLVTNPPGGDNINIALDRMMAVEWLNDTGLVEVEAGCHLGKNPYDPFNASTLENSFLYQAFTKDQGWGVSIVGGITHQTVSGFTGTGSAGGSIMYGYDNIVAFRVVDGMGNASWIEKGTDPEFDAMLTSLGLLGVITKMRFQLIPMYNIRGTQLTTTTRLEETDPQYLQCPIDLFGSGREGQPSLQQFLTDEPYSRITWWPQQGVERVQIWQAERVDPSTNNDPLVPYEEFTRDFVGQSEAFFASVIFVLAGNTSLPRIFSLLKQKANRYIENVASLGGKGAPRKPGRSLGAVALAGFGVLVASAIGAIPGTIHKLYPTLLPLFDARTKKSTAKKDNVLHFYDWYWRSLCMDNTADDELLCTEFCEFWVPIQYAAQSMQLMQAMFNAKGPEAIGWYAQEVYAAKASPAWLNPSYSDGIDEYKDGVIRFDVYWYRDNPGYPNVDGGFYQQYWEAFRAAGIPFRHHWGKYIPAYDLDGWAAYYKANLPRYGDFLTLRAQRDPQNVFFTNYWQTRLLGSSGIT